MDVLPASNKDQRIETNWCLPDDKPTWFSRKLSRDCSDPLMSAATSLTLFVKALQPVSFFMLHSAGKAASVQMIKTGSIKLALCVGLAPDPPEITTGKE